MQPGFQPVVLCAGIVVADAIASPVGGMGACSALPDAEAALAL